MKNMLSSLQRIGGALMLPIAVLPIAGLLLRLGQPDLLNYASMAAAGDAIFANLGLLFAIGVAVGLARENHGAAGLASVVGYLVTTKGAEVLIAVPPDAVASFTGQARDLAVAAYKAHELGKLSVPVGIISGLIAGGLYNRFSEIRLPSYLAFFGGRRFVPIASGFAGLLVAAVFGWEWQRVETGMDALSQSVLHAGAFGLFAYGVLNRILIVTGLHHIINNIAWFLLGDYNGTTGDLKRFFAGDPSAGAFMAGFFPVMMFGLPAACLAMYHAARPERRKAVAGLLGSIALTSLLTGVTEPIEFTFIFLAPALYAVHALLTGVAFVIMNALHVRLGFGFSAGLFDYVLNFNKATRPLLLLPVGLAYFGLYYGLFRFVISWLNLKTPGREDEPVAVEAESGAPADRALAYIKALGGAANIVALDACTTRLRLVMADQSVVDEAALKRLGARGMIRPSATALQVVVGTDADQVAGEMKIALRAAGAAAATSPATAASAAASTAGRNAAAPVTSGAAALDLTPSPTAPPPSLPPIPTPTLSSLLTALGGRANVRAIEAASTRLRINIVDPTAVNESAILSLGLRGVAQASPNWVHVIVGPEATTTGVSLRQLL
ncbi:MAG TPA: N-acetylglucosamine-specific PTS transporter subunit IIBC [Steroidobacteraceae bacterium]|nr:N-acetylglucosamine-specific PTS transporter subunit IIBC [Steroidobacteraceae bacterium]